MSVRVLESPTHELRICYRDPALLKSAVRNPRTHSPKQVDQIAASIRQFGFNNPVLLDDEDRIIAGHGRVAAAKRLKLSEVPVIRLSHLSPAQRRAYALADNRLAELAGWDESLLALELQELSVLEVDFELEITGFEGAELDGYLGLAVADGELDPELDQIPEAAGPAVSRPGDRWILGEHVVLCGDARDPAAYAALMAGDQARMVFTDPPYNVAIDGNVGGKGRIARREFVMASGEMSEAEFTTFLTEAHTAMTSVLVDGAIVFSCMDWRHIGEQLAALKAAQLTLKNLVIWNKTNAGMGQFYRSQHELVFVTKHGRAKHTNNFGLGETGRHRPNVWTYPGVNTFRRGRDEELALHPTVKPVALVADAILDVSRRGEIVLDPFGGSGTTLIAAERTGRRARLMELDPLYVDAICRRFQAITGVEAVLEGTGQGFAAVAAERVTSEGD
jgi:DNA modification methylase